MQPSLATHRRIVVGLDFGTHSSGFAYAVNPKQLSNEAVAVMPRLCHSWPDQPGGLLNAKTRTALLYHGTTTPAAWGWSALKPEAASDAPSGRVLERFKLALAGEAAYRDFALPVGFSDVQVAADYLSYMRRHIMPHLRSALGTPVGADDIQWCLTVPAMWSDAAKSKMRRAALRAGLISQLDSDALLVVLEPEAAALHVTRAGGDVRPGDVCMVVDAGGGTVDVTLHCVTERAGLVLLTEAAIGTGGFCGSTFVDERWEKHCSAAVGAEAYTAWRRECPEEHQQLQSKWEAVKCSFGGALDSGPISSSGSSSDSHSWGDTECPSVVMLPPGLCFRMSHNSVAALQASQRGCGDCLMLPASTMQRLFDPVVEQVLSLARQQLRSGRRVGQACTKMVLVGGFAESPYLQRCVRREFSVVLDADVIVPQHPATAVLQGAVLFGCNPLLIGSRISRVAYGVMKCQRADQHPGQGGRWWNKDRDCYYVSDVFSRFVKRGQVVGVGETVSCVFHPAMSTADHITFKLFSTVDNSVKYTTDKDMVQEGSIQVDLPAGWCNGSNKMERMRGYNVKVVMRFGLTELAVEAIDQQTGRKAAARIMFQQERCP